MSRKNSQRKKAKYPAIKKQYNLKMRQDYMDIDYVGGVYNEDGELVIRPLNHEEKEFLNKFYEETVNANFLHDNELKKIKKKIDEIKSLENPSQEQLEKFDYLMMLFLDKSDEVLLHSSDKEQKKLYGENNARNRCLYNRAKASGKLAYLRDNYSSKLDDFCYYDKGFEKNIYIDDMEYLRKNNIKKRNEEEE